jgi:hypothetical protein
MDLEVKTEIVKDLSLKSAMGKMNGNCQKCHYDQALCIAQYFTG